MAAVAGNTVQPNASDKISWGSMKATRTQAMPKHSLFGTALEHVDRDELQNIEGRYIPEGFIKETPNRYPLPPHIKESIPGRDTYEVTRKAVAEKKDALSQADQQLKTKSENSLSFKVPVVNPQSSHGSLHSSRPTWLSEKDLEHSKDMNILGLSERGSYNRDKYSRKPKVHNYSLIGDILAPKMDFNSIEAGKGSFNHNCSEKKSNVALGPGRNLPHELMKKYESSKNKEQSKSVIYLPPNIRHQFGSRVCDTLLSDQTIVSLALERQKTRLGPPRPSKRQNIESLRVNMNANYESLGNVTRHNVCPGVSSGHKISRTKDEFNDEVHQRRVPPTDEFRYQRDELSTWSEHNVLRERMKKAWDEAYPLGIWVEQDVLRKRMELKWKSYFENLPKADANWDRSAKRPQVIPAVKAPPKLKPKMQQKPKKKPGEVPDETEPEIVFVTPPLTPPAPEREMVELPQKFERDDEFWSFYDQPAA